MRRIAAFVAGVMLVGLMAAARADNPPAGAPPPAPSAIQTLIQKADASLKASDWAGAEAALNAVVADDGFSGLDPKLQHSVYHFLALSAHFAGDDKTAQRAAIAATGGDGASGQDWLIRFYADGALRDDADCTDSLAQIAETWPALLGNINDLFIVQLIYGAKNLPIGQERQLRLLKALFAAHWKPQKQPAHMVDEDWLDLVDYDLEYHDTAAAEQVAAIITDPAVLIDMRIARKYDAIVAADPDHFDLNKIYDRSLALARADMAAHPELLSLVVDTAHQLNEMQRPAEALALLDDALARDAAAPSGKSPFADRDEELNWLHDARATALVLLGRFDDAVAEMTLGANMREQGSANVSQTINLAEMYNHLDRPQDALRTLANFDPSHATPYGLMAMEVERGCAYAQLRDGPNLAKSLAFIAAHSGDAPRIRLQMAVCQGNVDDAAAAIIAELSDPDEALAALNMLQIGGFKPSAVRTPYDRKFADIADALRKRQDVQQAVAKVGRILTLPD